MRGNWDDTSVEEDVLLNVTCMVDCLDWHLVAVQSYINRGGSPTSDDDYLGTYIRRIPGKGLSAQWPSWAFLMMG